MVPSRPERRLSIVAYWSESHYRDHLTPIVEGLQSRGVEVLFGEGWPTIKEAETADLVLVASRGDSRRFPRVALVEHGTGQRYGVNAGGADTPEPQIELFLAPSQKVCDQDVEIYPNALRLPVGSPRVEHLDSLSRNPEKVVVAFHWQSGQAHEARSAWDWHQRALPELSSKFPLLGHGHPRMLRRLQPGFIRNNVPVEPSWEECVRQASVLVCDNSSIIWEACALGIPVVLLDAPWYQRTWGLRFWEYADVGPRTDNHKEVAGLVEEVLAEDRWKARREEVAQILYGEIEGSTDRAVEAILGIL